MICYHFTNYSTAGSRLHLDFLFLTLTNPHAPTVNICKYYDCPYGYEYKEGYEDTVCEDECDDRDCCDKGECAQHDVVYSKTDIVPVQSII